MISDAEIKDDLVFSVMADDIGLYEAYWSVPNGEIYDDEFGYSKERSWDDVAKIVYALVEEEFLSVNFGVYSRNERITSGLRDILFNKKNWEPFSMSDVEGFFLSEGDETVARRLSGRSIRESFF